MTRRPGLSLIEVLTALFIMGIGAIAILTLFPLGAINMANANRDDRSSLAAFGADNYFRTYWRTEIVERTTIGEQFYAALDNPGNGLPAPGANQVSYPVFVDPMGFYAPRPSGSNPSASTNWIGDNPTNIPRRNLSVVTNSGGLAPQVAQRLCSLMDSIGAEANGVPNTDRELRYNFLWVIQRPNNSSSKTVNCNIVVFDRRANGFAPVGSEQVIATVANGMIPGTTSITFASAPDVKPGAWIMDGTINPAGRPALKHATFYRVTAVTDNTVELQSPIKTPSDGGGAYTGTIVILRGVSGVYPRPPLTAD